MITVFKDNYGRYTFYEFEGKRLLIKSVEYVEENECTCIKIAHPDGLYVVNDFIVTHNTAIAIKSICNIKKLPMIIVRGLVQQWKNEFLKFTNLNEKDIYIIQGIDSIVKLKKLNYYPKIFICSLNTCRNWLYNDEYKKIITYQNFLEEYKIAIKVIDECHRDFHTLVQIDLCSNVQHNIYLSATYGRTDSYERNIFNMIFPPDIVFNEGSLEKYVKVYFYNYSLGYMKKLNENTIRGYSQSKYEQYILKHESIFNRLISNVLLSIIEQHFFKIKRPIEKLLILVHTIDLADAITEKLMEEYGDMNLNIKRYTGPDPVSNLNDGTDIIISTPSSSGTGVDIKHLRTVILMDSFASSILTKQIFGRLRKLEDNVEPEFIDMFNRDIEAHIRHKRFRSDVYYKLAKEYHDKYIY
jgi:superfamily II DNA or RNA helicase